MVRRASAIAISVLVALTGCGGSGRPDPGAVKPTASTTSAALPSYVVRKVELGKQPCAVEGGFGSIWVSVYGEDTELRIDPTSGKVLARIKTKLAPCGVAVGGGAVWVEDYGGNAVTRIDPETNAATTINVGHAPYDVTFAVGAAWVTNYGDDTVSRIDATSLKVQTIKVGLLPVGIAPAAGAVWVTDKGDGTIDRIDTGTLTVTSTKVRGHPTWTSWGDGLLWVAYNNSVAEVALKGHEPGRLIARRSIGTSIPLDGDIVDGMLWLPDSDGRLHGYDARTGDVVGTWPTGLSQPFVVAGYAGKLWTVDFDGTALEEIDPARLR